jgi:hypothetical protein
MGATGGAGVFDGELGGTSRKRHEMGSGPNPIGEEPELLSTASSTTTEKDS